MSRSLVELLHESVERAPWVEAIVHAQQRVSYGELWRKTGALGSFLRRQGLCAGDRVALLLENSPEYAAAYYGVLCAGGVVVALNTQAKARDLANWLQHCGATWLIASAQHPEFSALMSQRGDFGVICVSRNRQQPGVDSDTRDWNEVLTEEATDYLPGVPVKSGDLAQIIYTSGTTGAPKGVMLSHGNLYANTQSILAYLKLTANDRILNVLPFYYSYGNSVLHTHLAVGASIVLENSLAYPHAVVKRMAEEGVTGFSGVPSTFALLLNRVKLGEYDLSRVRYMTQAGGAMSPAHIKRLKEELPHVNFFVMYGQTEATARIAFLPPEQLETKIGAAGIAIPGVMMELRDEHGRQVARGTVGEIWVRGENVMLGYWNNPDATASVIRDGWIRTGDLAHQDSDGYFFIQGRRSDMIKSGAHRISPQEIEEAILELEGVAEVAVVGQADDILGETIKAVVVPRAGFALDPRAVQVHCHQRLALYKVPKRVEFVDELPKTASGKVKRFELTGDKTLP